MQHHLSVPTELERHGAYAPLIALLRDVLVRPNQLADRWGVTPSHLSNLRRSQRALPYMRLPTGAKGKGSIRYRLSDIVSAEVLGTSGAINLERVLIAVAACDFLAENQRAATQDRLRKALGEPPAAPHPAAAPRPVSNLASPTATHGAPRKRGRPSNAELAARLGRR
jgi:hypothetical protein